MSNRKEQKRLIQIYVLANANRIIDTGPKGRKRRGRKWVTVPGFTPKHPKDANAYHQQIEVSKIIKKLLKKKKLKRKRTGLPRSKRTVFQNYESQN